MFLFLWEFISENTDPFVLEASINFIRKIKLGCAWMMFSTSVLPGFFVYPVLFTAPIAKMRVAMLKMRVVHEIVFKYRKCESGWKIDSVLK